MVKDLFPLHRFRYLELIEVANVGITLRVNAVKYYGVIKNECDGNSEARPYR